MKDKDFGEKYQEIKKKQLKILNFEIMHLFFGDILPSD